MAVNQIAYNKKKKLIYEAYCAQWGEGFRDEVIFDELADHFHLQPKTIQNIVRKVRKESQLAQPEFDFESLTPNPSPIERGLNSKENEAE